MQFFVLYLLTSKIHCVVFQDLRIPTQPKALGESSSDIREHRMYMYPKEQQMARTGSEAQNLIQLENNIMSAVSRSPHNAISALVISNAKGVKSVKPRDCPSNGMSICSYSAS